MPTPNGRMRTPKRVGQSGRSWGMHPATADLEYTAAEVEFMMAMDRFIRLYRCPRPTAADVLAVLRELGYQRVAPPQPLPRR